MAISLIMSVVEANDDDKKQDKNINKKKFVETTLAKAKVLRTFVEPILTASKADITYAEANAKTDEEKLAFKIKRMAAHRFVFSKLADKEAVKALFAVVTPKIYDRPGGYTRILKTGSRLGDNAKTCIIELVDFNENYKQGKSSAKPAAKATRRSRKKKATDAPAAEATENKAE